MKMVRVFIGGVKQPHLTFFVDNDIELSNIELVIEE